MMIMIMMIVPKMMRTAIMKMWQVNYLQIAIPSVPCLNLGNSNRHQRENLDFKNMKIGAILD